MNASQQDESYTTPTVDQADLEHRGWDPYVVWLTRIKTDDTPPEAPALREAAEPKSS